MQPSSKRPLSAKQKAFARHYVVLGEGKAAAIKAGYSKGSAHVTASRLLRRPLLRQFIADMQSKSNEYVNRMLSAESRTRVFRSRGKRGRAASVASEARLQVAAILSRASVNRALMENFEQCLGRRDIVVAHLIEGRKATANRPADKPRVVDIPVRMFNPAGANKAAALLLKELDRQEAAKSPAPTNGSGGGRWKHLADIYNKKSRQGGGAP